jgi:hypothetical protein
MPSISADGLVLFFMSSRAGGFGGNDLWFTRRATKNDPWGSPVNLGATVNSSLHEAFPDISADRRMLFFSEHMFGPFRPGGYGGQDLWVTTRATTNDPWGEPMNLGPVINTSYWEFSPNISADGSTLYFGSMPPGGTGNADLWRAPIIPVVDFNGDEMVDFKDFSKLAQYWKQNEAGVDIGPTPLGDGTIDFRDLAVFAEHFRLGGRPFPASNPNPADGSTGISTTAFLSWTAGDGAESHEVYFGTAYPLPLVSTETDTTYAPPVMARKTTYYWRIDEVNSKGKTTGQTWSFITETGIVR